MKCLTNAAKILKNQGKIVKLDEERLLKAAKVEVGRGMSEADAQVKVIQDRLAELRALRDRVEKDVISAYGVSKGETNAGTVQPIDVPVRDQGQDQANVGNRDSDRQQVGAGLAEGGQGAVADGRVPAGADRAGAEGNGNTEPAGSATPVELGEGGNVRADAGATGPDFVITAEDEIGKGGLGQKYRDNVAAIRLLKTLETEGRTATPDERKTLAKYVGWGALKGVFDSANKQWSKQYAELKELLTEEEYRAARESTLDAHYTSVDVVSAMFDALTQLGVTGGRILEPSVGIGNFFGLMPKGMRNASQLYGVELDSLTSRMVSALYPSAKIAKATGFENYDVPGEFFDVVIGNPPFGNTPIVDAERSPYSGFSVHNYFMAKAIDKLRPGGVMAVVVSHNFMDVENSPARKFIAERANLIGGIRLPNTAFKGNAGTEVVTDILVFQKKGATESALPELLQKPWGKVVEQQNTNPKNGETYTHKVNEFFANPENVAGTPTAGGTMYGPNQYNVEANGDLKQQLTQWAKTMPPGLFRPIDRTADMQKVDAVIPDGIKVGSFYVDETGSVMRRGPDALGNKTADPWAPPNEKAVQRMKGMIQLRDTLRAQMRMERSVDFTQDQIEANRKLLNEQYDDFYKKFGHLNSPTNRRIFFDDTEAQLLFMLEFDYDKGISKATADKEGIEPKEPSAVKADIMKRRVAFPPQDFMNVATAKDALLASLNYRGRVDLAYMREIYKGKTDDQIIAELGEVVFDDPKAGIVTADEYLSGDVKTKLAEAKAAGKGYERNVAELEKVIPKDKKPSEISAHIGAAFVPAEYYEQFVKHISGAGSTAKYIKATGQWVIAFEGNTDPALNTGKFGTSKLDSQSLFELSLMGKGAIVKQIIKNPDGTTTTVVLEKETEAAREKQNAIKAEWQKWLWEDPERADKVAAIYNEKMNRIVERKFDGSHMTFPGMSPAISLLQHQKNGVWRGLQDLQVLYDHVVGAGKTFEMATLAMEMRRLGIARKPVFVVPNHLTLQWQSEFARLYPGANVLAATPDDFKKGLREKLFSKIALGDWDAVVIGHSSLKKIGLPIETEKAVIQEQIDEISAAIEEMKRARGDKRIVADMERIKKNLQAKMDAKLAAIGKRDKVVTFDELGIDAMFVDEMHEFKNLTYNSTMDRNPGMGNPAGSAKAFDMFVKVRWLFDTFGERTPFVTATGTPVSNSLVEMFNMQRYMQYPTLKDAGLHVFDAWAKQFGNVESVYEVAPSGSGYRQSTRFAKFTNLPALMSLYNSFADTITLDDLKAQEEARGKRFPVPKIQGGRPTNIVAKRSPMVADFMGVPKAEIGEDGSIKFDVDLAGGIEIEQDKQNGKWGVKVGNNHLGYFDTEQDARLKVVERALSPTVTVDPKSILGQFANLKQLTKDTKGKINALSLTGLANKAGLDFRLINPSAPDFAGSKINLAIDQMMIQYKKWAKDKGAQLVFCDLSIPLSARASYSSKARKLYVRDGGGLIVMKKGTMHTVEGHEDLPFFVVQRGEKEAKRFDAFDAATGLLMKGDYRSKHEAVEGIAEIIKDDAKRERLVKAREETGEIEQGQIDDYNNDNDIEIEDPSMFFTREDIAGMSGATAFSVYDDIKAKLMKAGVPEREIAFIHDYDTPVQKAKLFKAVNSGAVRFLLGSTPKMGAGTNVQERLVALHHIDAPWRPSDLEQREGRIIRRGNKLYERDPDGFEIFIGRYATEQTYDTRRWQILEHKARGIEQLRNFDGTMNEIDDIAGEAANSADMKAAASGDPLILEETQLRNEVKRLERLQAAHADEQMAMVRRARDMESMANKFLPKRVEQLQRELTATHGHPLDKDGHSPISLDGKELPADKDKLAAGLTKGYLAVVSHEKESVTFTYRGIDFRMDRGYGESINVSTESGNVGTYMPGDTFSPSGFVQRLKNYVERLQPLIEHNKAQISKNLDDAAAMREQAKEPFGQSKELDKAREDHKAVQRKLMAKGPAVPDEQKAAVAEATEKQKARLRELGFGESLKELLGDAPMFSRSPTSGAGLSSQAFTAELSKAFGRKAAERLLSSKIITLLPDQSQLPAHVIPYLRDGDRIFGFFDPVTDKTYAVLSNLKAGDIKALALHEVGIHYGLRQMLGQEKYASVIRRMNRMVDDGDKAALAARKNAVAQSADKGQIEEETLAYLVQNHPDMGLVREVIAKIRAWLFNRFGILADRLTKDDMAMLARASVMKARVREGGADSGVAMAREGARFGPVDTESAEFKRWLGGSKAVFHVTPTRNVNRIMRDGLLPSVGSRSSSANERDASIFVFDSPDALEDALSNWLGEEFGDDEKLSVLVIKNAVSTPTPGAEYESTINEAVEPAKIFAFTQDLDSDPKIIDRLKAATNPNIHFSRVSDALQTFRQDPVKFNTFGWWDKSLGTQYHKAMKDQHFAKVFALVNAMQNEISLTSIRPAELAPNILPRVDNVKAAIKTFAKGKKADKQLDIATRAIFIGTTYGQSVLQGKVFSIQELQQMGLDDRGIRLYHEARNAIDASLDEVAAAEAFAMATGFIPKALRRQIIDNPRMAKELIIGAIEQQMKTLQAAIKVARKNEEVQKVSALEASLKQFRDTKVKIETIFNRATQLKEAGYAPLMRFGKYFVKVSLVDPETGALVRDENGDPVTDYRSHFETEGEAKLALKQLQEMHEGDEGMRITFGVRNDIANQLYQGISPETIALFADALGEKKVKDKYIQEALSERSALKRRLERKGIAGYSEDMPRVLSNFITSNGRFAAQQYYMRDINNAIKFIPVEKGDVQKEAQKLKNFIVDPADPAAPVSSIMFAWFLGGSIASAAVNMTQPLMMTAPYLSQFGVKESAAALTKAIPMAMGRKQIADADLRNAIKRAGQEGIVDAQEIFHLYSLGAQGVAAGLTNYLSKIPVVGGKVKAGSESARARINAFLTIWGSMFAAAESFNRRLTFIAAWDVAKATGVKDPYAFAVRAVNQTQGIYNKANRPNWARGPVGRIMLTFKQYSIMYVELISRMVKRGGPEGKRAALIMLGVLMLMSGEEGLPFVQDLDDLIDTIGQMFGYDTNMRRDKRALAHEILGKELGELFLYGLSSQLPLDWHGRLGMGNLIPGTALFKKSEEAGRSRQVAEIFGPAAGMGTQLADAYDAMGEGNPGQALTNMAPSAIKNLIQGTKMAVKDQATDAKGRKVVETDGMDAFWKSIGFNPTVVANEHRRMSPIQQDIALTRMTESSIVQQWARGVVDQDKQAMDEARLRLEDWNKHNPKNMIRITPDQVRAAARNMLTGKEARVLKQAPREIRGGLLDRLKE